MSYILCQILREKKPVTVFYHMNHKALAFQGLILEIFGIHQTLWYSHAKKDSYLRIAKQFADLIITTGDEAFPLNHKNVLKVGQAVSSHKFHFTKELNFHDKRKMSILSVGRIGQAKNLEKLICSDFDLRDMKDFSIVLVGPKTDPAYVNQLSTFAKLRGIDISFHSSIRNEELSTLYRDYDFYFTGTEKAIDKSAAEAAMCGLVVISDNNSLLKLLCLDAKSLSVANSNWAIKDQIEFYANLSGERLWRLQEQTSEIAKHVFSLENVIEKYLEVYSAVNITKNYP
jgi:glycosyltransferase involved in cell wall biosynthesis